MNQWKTKPSYSWIVGSLRIRDKGLKISLSLLLLTDHSWIAITSRGYEIVLIFNYEEFQVEDKYLAAARQQNGTADAALQNALGVLYNLNRNFDRAVECIKLAIASQPQDPRLWNRLGATLANGDRTTDAIGAYREALTRYPTYVRARYNLGISCMHLSSHREAIEHFISALELQKGGSEGHSIWPTLR